MKQSPRRKVFNWFIHSWGISIVITVVPSILLAYISIWKPIVITSGWRWGMTIAIAASAVFSILRYWADSVDNVKRQNADRYYQALTERNLGAINSFTETIIGYIREGKNKEVCKPFDPFSNINSRLSPFSRIKRYIENTCTILAQFFDTDDADIGVGLYIKNNREEWKPFYQLHVSQHDQDFFSTLSNSSSSFHQVSCEPNKTFFMEKQRAYDSKMYSPTPDEKQNNINGTIYCKNISLTDRDGQVLCHAVICITTYETLVCADSDVFAKKKAAKLFQKIGSEIQYEIANLLLEQHLGLCQSPF